VIKFTSNHDWDFQVESVSLLRDVSRDLVKRGSSQDLFKGIKKDPKQEDLHVIALGSAEKTGQNRNGDYWTEKTCQANHSQFTDANRAIHKHHKNKPNDPKFGNIKASTYNEKMGRIELVIGLDKDSCAKELHEFEKTGNLQVSMACFPAGAQVLLGNNTETAIESVRVGDSVVTHNGNIGKVTHTSNRWYEDNIVTLQVYGLPDKISCTRDHLIWARPKYRPAMLCPICGNKFENLKSHIWQSKDLQHKLEYSTIEKLSENWVRAEDLNIKDYVRTPFSTKITEEGDKNYAVILGYYLAEGHIFNSEKYTKGHHLIGFTFNKDETNMTQELTEALVAYGVPAARIKEYSNFKQHVRRIHAKDAALMEKLRVDAGQGSTKKVISPKIMTWAPSTQKIILEKWLEGDGHFRTTSDNTGRITGSTVSRRLAFNMAEICWRNNIIANVTCERSKNKNHSDSYLVNIGTEYLNEIAISKKPGSFVITTEKLYSRPVYQLSRSVHAKPSVLTKKQDLRKSFIENGFVYRKIRKISHKFNRCQVYDITVPGDDSFLISQIGVHNCKVPHDICSVCGFHAQDDKIRCEHIPAKLGELLSDGRMVGMENPASGKWFELSLVKRGADRIAFGLSKMASIKDNIRPMLPRDYLNIYGDIYVPDDIYLSKKAADKRELLHKLAALEKHVEGIAQGHAASSKDRFIKQHAHKISKGKKIDPKAMDEIRKHEPKEAFKSMADQGVIMGPEDFSKYVFGDRVDQKHVEGMKTHLPDIFSKLDSENDGKVTNDEKFEPGGNVKPELKHTVGKLKEDHSLSGGPAVRRMMIISISLCSPEEGLKPAHEAGKTKEAFDQELARQYAGYKISQLAYLDEQGKLDDDLMLNSVIQNRA
jgi:hypothetical protein